MDTFYLIDYENVNTDGLAGCSQLSSRDHIMIFFTQNSKKIDMSEIANHGDAKLEMIEIPAGKQSVDIHIGSYLGYFAGKDAVKDTRIVIISKDTDFDNIIKFWEAKTGLNASRAHQIKQGIRKETTKKQEQNADAMNAAPVKNADPQPSVSDKTAVNNTVMQLLSKAGFEPEIVGYVASTVVKNMGKERGKQQIYRAIISQYGQDKGLNIYNHIKKSI